jgi:diacylglycerol kinase family enzyme
MNNATPVTEQNNALPTTAILIVNVMSRNGAQMFDQVRDKLVAAGVDLIGAYAIDEPGAMEPAVRDAVARAPMVIIGGGDGSLSSNVDFFVGQDTVFAFVPLGTANSFAGTLGIPKDVDSAIDVIANGTRKWIDLGRINDDYFVNAAAIGLSPIIAQTVPHKLKRYLGVFGYLIWAFWCALRFRPFRMTLIHDDGRRDKLWATEIRIANGTHHGGVEYCCSGRNREEHCRPRLELVRDHPETTRPSWHHPGVSRHQYEAGHAA